MLKTGRHIKRWYLLIHVYPCFHPQSAFLETTDEITQNLHFPSPNRSIIQLIWIQNDSLKKMKKKVAAMIYRYFHLRNQAWQKVNFCKGTNNRFPELLKATHQKLPTLQEINWKMASPCPNKRLLTKCPVITIAWGILKPGLPEEKQQQQQKCIPGYRSGRWSEITHPTLEKREDSSVEVACRQLLEAFLPHSIPWPFW